MGERRVGSTLQDFEKSSHITPIPLPPMKGRSENMELNEEQRLEREKLVKKEEKRLLEVYKDLSNEKLKVAQGLIKQAARNRVMLNYMWEDIQENGEYDLFQQSQNVPAYERERPVARLYNTRDQSYQRAIKQLTDLLPKESKPVETDDPVDDYV